MREWLLAQKPPPSQHLFPLPCEDLRDVDVALRVLANADAYTSPGGGENVAAMTVAGHEGGLRLFNGGMVRNVLSGGGEGIAEVLQHVADGTVGGGGVRKIMVVAHVLGFLAGNGAQLLIQGQSRQTI